ncbi:substrate-binding domain-containing protein [Actinopolyspora mzabensis]|uniref:substrate-binding domain-containing protein n=1 Tax=Actinopolyspora mzabensis TaxID=995066 RepID=UPI003183EBCC
MTGSARFELHLRVSELVGPGFAVRINGARQPVEASERGYAVLSREWRSGDAVDVELPFQLRAGRTFRIPPAHVVRHGAAVRGSVASVERIAGQTTALPDRRGGAGAVLRGDHRCLPRLLLQAGAANRVRLGGLRCAEPAGPGTSRARTTGWRPGPGHGVEVRVGGGGYRSSRRASWRLESRFRPRQRTTPGQAFRRGCRVRRQRPDGAGVLHAFHERGVRVPADVLVAGFDDSPDSAYFTPPLTTVRQNFDAVGRRSMDVLLQRINSPAETATRVVIRPELVARQSTIGRLRTPPAR